MVLFYIGVVSVFILSLVYYGFQAKYNYWKKQKVHVPGPKPLPIVGNYKDYVLMQKSQGLTVDSICKQFSNAPYIGVYYGFDPTLIVQDPELLKIILTKDFYYFNGREASEHSHREPLGKILFNEHGDRWKVVRQNLTPLFTSSKMKNMFYLIEKCSVQFENLLDKNAKLSDIVEVRSLVARYTIDCIGTCAFGVETNVMQENLKNPFRHIADDIFNVSYKRGAMNVGKSVWPSYFYALGLTRFPKNINDFFNTLLSGIFQQRQYKPTSKNDFVDLVLNFKAQNYITGDAMSNLKSNEKKKTNIEVDDQLLIAQCFLFFAAGFETSATTSSYTLYELAKNQEAQEKAYNDVVQYLKKNNNQLGFNCITDLPYLEACVDEALRLYPVLSNLTREVMEDYELPDGLFLKKGTRIHIPVFTIQRNEEHYPNAAQYRPERFLPENAKEIKPYTYMPFGEGPRICIGMRFAKMQSIAGLITILKKYKLTLAEGMTPNVQFEPTSNVTIPRGGIRLKFTPREGWETRVFNQ